MRRMYQKIGLPKVASRPPHPRERERRMREEELCPASQPASQASLEPFLKEIDDFYKESIGWGRSNHGKARKPSVCFFRFFMFFIFS